MFASQVIATYTDQIEFIAADIQDLEEQLDNLREQQKQLEAERQALQTMASAGQSAIDQARQFLTIATRSDRQDLIEAFWSELDSIRNEGQAIADLPSEPEETEDVEVEAITVDPEPEPEQFNYTDLKTRLHSIPYQELRNLAKANGIDPKGKKTQLIIRLCSLGVKYDQLAKPIGNKSIGDMIREEQSRYAA